MDDSRPGQSQAVLASLILVLSNTNKSMPKFGCPAQSPTARTPVMDLTTRIVRINQDGKPVQTSLLTQVQGLKKRHYDEDLAAPVVS